MASAELDPQRSKYIDACARGKIPDCAYEVKFASRSNVAQTEVPIWGGGVSYTFLDTPETINISSTNINDSISGTGAQIIRVIGQANGAWVKEDVEMNGSTPVVLSSQMDFIYRMLVIQSGTTGTPLIPAIGNSRGALGIITAMAVSSAVSLADINNGNNVTIQSMVRVPDGEEWQIAKAVLTGGITKQINFKLYIRIPGTDIFVINAEGGIVESSLVLDGHRIFPSGTDLLFTASSDTGSTSVSVLLQFLRFGQDMPILN